MAVRCMVHGRIYNPRIPRSGVLAWFESSTATMPGNHAGARTRPTSEHSGVRVLPARHQGSVARRSSSAPLRRGRGFNSHRTHHAPVAERI